MPRPLCAISRRPARFCRARYFRACSMRHSRLCSCCIVFMIHPMLGGLVLPGICILLIVTLLNQWALNRPQQQGTEATAVAGNLVMAFTRSGEAMRAMGMSNHAIGIGGMSPRMH